MPFLYWMSDLGTKKAFWWVPDWIYYSFGDDMKMKVRGVTFERRHIEKYEKQGMCKLETDFFLDYTWPPIFSLFFPRIWIDLYNKACLACGKGIKIAKISWWKLVILYELYRDLELVDRYLEAILVLHCLQVSYAICLNQKYLSWWLIWF